MSYVQKSIDRARDVLTAPRFTLKDQVFFAKRLSFLMNANVPLLESLHMLLEQTKSPRHCAMLQIIVNDVMSGQSISKSFAKFPNTFSEFAVSIIRVGETSGTLSQNLNYLSDELRKSLLLRRKIISALIYPAIIAIAVVATVAFLMLYLFPKIMPIFSSLNAELPLATKVVMAVSVFFQVYGLWFLVGVLLSALGIILALKYSPRVHYYVDKILIRMPFVGSVVRYYNVANISRTLGLLLRSGLTLSAALPIVAQTTKNKAYREHFVELHEVVNRGGRLSEYFKEHPRFFPPVLAHMVAVGERSGTLSDSLLYLSDLFEHEVDEFTKNLSSLLEPALMIVMGLIVGLIAISIITPIYGITQNLHN